MNNSHIQQSFEKWSKPLYSYIFRALHDVELSKELLQQCFLLLLEKQGTWENQGAVKVFLFRTAHHLIQAQWRKNVRQPQSLDEQTLTSPPRDHTALVIRQALARLPQELREPLILKEYHGFKYSEIAEMLDCPVGTVRSRLHRAREISLQILKEPGLQKETDKVHQT